MNPTPENRFIENKGVYGIRRLLMNCYDFLFFRLPLLSEVANQVSSKNSGLLLIWHFLNRGGIQGDYLEFGVFRGETFRNVIWAAKALYRMPYEQLPMRFFAFDSFEGLPASLSEHDRGTWQAGEFKASEKDFLETLGCLKNKIKVQTIPGWFNQSLKTETAQKLGLNKIAFANIDCDLYESTADVLKFITPFLQTGTVIYFDDWFSVQGSMNHGEPRACREWLEQNPKIKLVDYRSIGVTGKIFIVNLPS